MVEGKVVIVTGAGGGIGRDIALAMAREGAKVVVNDIGAAVDGEGRNAGPAQQVVDEIRALGGQAAPNADSVAEAASAAKIVQCALDSFGRVDVVVNNAGILRDRFFHKMSVDEWDAVIKVHLYGAYFVSRAAANHFKEQNSGAFVHMTSTSGLIGNFGQANYAAAKLGIAALSKSIALDMQKFNVRSNCIAPFAWSRMIGSIPTETEDQKARVAKIQQMTPAKIAPLAVYLASDAAAQVTGQIFSVRNNEIFLMSQPRPVRSVHRSEGWTPQTVAEHAMPALRASFFPLERSADV
ncbi:MAG: SDR family oxidoreductase, partial [Burkholderiaceae bacterium]|nr:SDR family oxidoreductase [Burkholderiaceae bacterium]